jgi:hypothetical protein
MKVYFVELEGEGEIYCYENAKDALETVEVWAAEDLKTADAEDQKQIREEIADIKEVVAKDVGGFSGEWYSLWIEVKSREWFDSLPHDPDEAFQEEGGPPCLTTA